MSHPASSVHDAQLNRQADFRQEHLSRASVRSRLRDSPRDPSAAPQSTPTDKTHGVSGDWAVSLTAIAESLDDDVDWSVRFGRATHGATGLHLAVCIEPYLSYILCGQKTIESRFGLRRSAPYGRVQDGDVVMLKQASGPVVGLCEVSVVWAYEIHTPEQMQEIRRQFSRALCASDPEFWIERNAAQYVTLMQVTNVRSVSPVAFPKRDQRGWVVLKTTGQIPLLSQ